MSEREELAALWRALRDGDDTAKLALADWYLEHKNPSMAHALKWCVARQRWPRVTPKERYAVWERQAKRRSWTGLQYRPHQIFDPYVRYLNGHHSSLRVAIEMLAFALDDLKSLIRVPGEGVA